MFLFILIFVKLKKKKDESRIKFVAYKWIPQIHIFPSQRLVIQELY